MSDADNSHSVSYQVLDTANGKQLAVATLNEEKTLNALTLEMVDSLYQQLSQWQSDDAIVAVLLQGAGTKAFCAGGDVQQLYHSAVSQPGGPCEYAEQFFEREYRTDYLIHRYGKPVICWGSGIVMGGGLGLMAGSSHRIVTETTRMAMPEITIGLYPDVGGSWFLNRAPGRTGLFLALTAANINAADSLFIGLADHFVAADSKEPLLQALLSADWSDSADQNAALTTQLIERISKQTSGQLPVGNVEAHYEQIQALTDFDNVADIVNNIVSLETEDRWLQRGVQALKQGSAISAANIYQALQQTRSMTLEQVFQFELMLSTNVVRHPEFAEGVRALLIDKDKQPKWLYQRVDDVPAALLAQMISSPWPQNPLAQLGAA